MSNVRRVYVEKKEPYAVAAKGLLEDIRSFLGITAVTGVRSFIRYDVENISGEVFEVACRTVFSEPPVDILYPEEIEVPAGCRAFGVEALPGQFDQRADSAVQCVRFLNENEDPVIRTEPGRGERVRHGKAGHPDRQLSGAGGREDHRGLHLNAGQ